MIYKEKFGLLPCCKDKTDENCMARHTRYPIFHVLVTPFLSFSLQLASLDLLSLDAVFLNLDSLGMINVKMGLCMLDTRLKNKKMTQVLVLLPYPASLSAPHHKIIYIKYRNHMQENTKRGRNDFAALFCLSTTIMKTGTP